jgi:hypothetical protein
VEIPLAQMQLLLANLPFLRSLHSTKIFLFFPVAHREKFLTLFFPHPLFKPSGNFQELSKPELLRSLERPLDVLLLTRQKKKI